MKENEIFENDLMRLVLKDGIVHGWYKKGVVDLEKAKRIVSERKAYTKGKTIIMLVRQEGLKGITREARQYLSSEEGVEGVAAGALIVNSAFESHMANFFIRITVIRPKVPSKVFTNEKNALRWLQQFKHLTN